MKNKIPKNRSKRCTRVLNIKLQKILRKKTNKIRVIPYSLIGKVNVFRMSILLKFNY